MENAQPDHNAYLSRLRFTTVRQRQAGSWGERRSTKHGEGIEFADFRHYTQGDALRSIDWNLYARFDKPYVRLHETEQNQTISLWIDTSHSMDYTDGDCARWDFTQHLARDLGSIALFCGDDLCYSAYPSLERTERLRGRGQLARWHHWIGGLHPQENTPEPGIPNTTQRPGIALILSDGYDVDWLHTFIPQLAAQRFCVYLLHILTPFERDPSLSGDLRLVDSENLSETPMTLGRRELRAYKEQFDAWQEDLRSTLTHHAGHYLPIDVARPVRQVLMEDLRRARLLQ